MKVGIMTMHRIPNYGSFMQALSLKKIIESLGHEVVFVDFKVEPDISHRGELSSKIKCSMLLSKKSMRSTLVGNSIYNFVKSHSCQKEDFNKKRIFFSCHNMLGITRKYRYRTEVDVLVIGSDEVFNCLQPGYNVGYSLELFGKSNRAKSVITYAASFGNTTLKGLKQYGVTKEIGGLIDKMNAVSVRDQNSYEIVENISNQKPEMHLDPVLVGDIESDSWKEIPLAGYVILYGYTNRFTLHECEKLLDFAHERNLKLIAIGEPQIKYDQYICCRPDEIITYFKNADYVITDTFHGTIFSVITHRQFLTIARPSVNEVGGNEEKIYSLIEQLDLNSRMVKDFSDIEKRINVQIDYDIIDKIRYRQKIETIDYLKKYIS